MDYRKATREELAQHAGSISSLQVLAGFDGFVDKIIHPIAQRHGSGDNYTAMPRIEDFGNRIIAAAGKSTNIELAPQMEKLGGNGPIMANALVSAGAKVRYIGALGKPAIHPVFESFAKKTQAISICDPGITQALEFKDGKIMLGTMASLDELTYDNLVKTVGEGAFLELLDRADLAAFVNWTMIPNMTEILVGLLERAYPNLGPHARGRHYFFDLADPEKRSEGDLLTVLHTLKRFRTHGKVTLGLNLKEGQMVDKLLVGDGKTETAEELKRLCTRIREKLEVNTVVVHPTDCAACSTREGAWWVKGPFTENPVITTGAGDHFNAGFAVAQTLGLSPAAALTVAVATSGQYVRSARSPSIYDTDSFLREWTD